MYRKSIIFTLIIALVIIIFGAYVRLLDTDPGCSDWSGWPGCSGAVNANSETSLLTVTEDDTVIYSSQMIYRYVIGFLGILSIFLAGVAWKQKHNRLSAVVLTSLLLLLVGLQIALGLWTDKMKIDPVFATGHLLLGYFTVWLLYWIYLKGNPKRGVVRDKILSGVRIFANFSMLLVLLQIITGFLVTTNHAGLACADFPMCDGVWVPAIDFIYALNPVSGLLDGYSSELRMDGRIAIQWIHRVGALVCFIVLTALMLSATSEKCPSAVRKGGLFLSILLLAQVLLGIFSIKLGLPVELTVAHTIVGVLMMLPLIAISAYAKYSYVDNLVDIDSSALVEDGEIVSEPSVEEVLLDSAAEMDAEYVEPTSESLYLRLKTQLKNTRGGLGLVLSSIPLGQKEISDDLLEELESSLLMADIGVDATTEIIAHLTESLERHELKDGQALQTALKRNLLEILEPCNQPLIIPQQQTPFVILVVGINGVGKTKTIGKLAKRLKTQGHSVMLAAGDTFRAAAVEQLEAWGERNEIHVVAQHTGADSASVIFDAVQSAQAKGIDVLIADTAGRLHTKSNLMEELVKIKRIMKKVDESAPHEVLLVLDAGTGQNAISQTRTFNQTIDLTGLAITKLDGTAKGGVIFALAKQFGLPLRFIGVGEGIDDLQDFDAKSFVDALFVKD